MVMVSSFGLEMESRDVRVSPWISPWFHWFGIKDLVNKGSYLLGAVRLWHH